MSQSLFTQSIEDATVSLTNAGANSNAAYLKCRDLRINGLDVAAGTSTIGVEMDWGVNTDVDYIIIGNLVTSAQVTIDAYYWTGAAWASMATDTVTGTGQNYYLATSTETATKYKFEITRSSSITVTASCVFIGEIYNMPSNYYVGDDYETFVRGEMIVDSDGYPHSNIVSTTQKQRWNITYGLTSVGAVNAVQAQILNAQFDKKPFFFLDTNRAASTYYLVRLTDASLRAAQPGAGFYRLTLNLEEI